MAKTRKAAIRESLKDWVQIESWAIRDCQFWFSCRHTQDYDHAYREFRRAKRSLKRARRGIARAAQRYTSQYKG